MCVDVGVGFQWYFVKYANETRGGTFWEQFKSLHIATYFQNNTFCHLKSNQHQTKYDVHQNYSHIIRKKNVCLCVCVSLNDSWNKVFVYIMENVVYFLMFHYGN